MSNLIAKEIIDTQNQLAGTRGTWENHWTEIARYVLQRQDDFYGTRTAGEKRTEYLFDSVGPMALEHCASAIESVSTPRSSRWHGLKTLIPELRDDLEVQNYYDTLTDMLFNIRYSGEGNFSSQWFETLMSVVAFGTGVMLVEDSVGSGIRYKSSHLSEHFLMENADGTIDTDYRRFKFTGLQAKKFYKDALSEKLLTQIDKNPLEKIEFIHCVRPNDDYVRGSMRQEEMRFVSHHVCLQDGSLLRTGGYRTFPFVVARFVTAPGEVYGRSPAMTALPEIKMVNQMRKTDLRARNLAVDPPILTANEASIRKINLKERAINYGTLDPNGNPLIRPWQSGASIELSNDAIQQSHDVINTAFMVKLFQLLVDTPQMTATEVLQRAQDKAALLAPTMGRIQSDALAPMIQRELDILSMAGALPEPPIQLQERGLDYEVEYTSPISQMQRASEALAVQRTVEATVPIANIDPSVMKKFNWSEYVKIMGVANGAPARLFYTDDQMAVINEREAQQQQMAMLTEAAPQMAGAVKDIAQAQSIAG